MDRCRVSQVSDTCYTRRAMSRSAIRTEWRGLGLLLLLAACGGGSNSPPPSDSAAIRTLAYAVTNCHEDANTSTWHQHLEILHGDGPAVTAMDIPTFLVPILPPPVPLPCAALGEFLIGSASVFNGGFQRIGASPDGSTVLFEVTFDFTLAGHSGPLTPEQQGIFVVRSDGSGLRRLGPASREPSHYLVPVSSGTVPFTVYFADPFTFSPDGRMVAFRDRGPGPEGDAIQIVTLDVSSGTRIQVTHLPATAPPDPDNAAQPPTSLPVFSDNATLLFYSRTNPDGLNPEGTTRIFSVRTDGSGLTVLPPPVAAGNPFTPVPSITGPNTNIFQISLPGVPMNPQLERPIIETFITNGETLLQLTNFQRSDTSTGTISADRRRVFFLASANPLELQFSNPSENCQIFSVDALGGDLRQITRFHPVDHALKGCTGLPLPGCYVGVDVNGGPFQDPETQSLVFNSSCDPLGTNPHGDQFFAMHPDGTGLRQLTATRGFVTAADGSVDLEIPGPQAYSALSGAPT